MPRGCIITGDMDGLDDTGTARWLSEIRDPRIEGMDGDVFFVVSLYLLGRMGQPGRSMMV